METNPFNGCVNCFSVRENDMYRAAGLKLILVAPSLKAFFQAHF